LRYTIEDIASIVGGRLTKAGDATIEHLLTDSRKLTFPSSCLFFALPGPRRDGHQFVQELFDRGVRSFVVNTSFDCSTFPDAHFVVVDDILAALHHLAAYHRRQFHLPVIGITGSNGKTIVKEWLNHLLEEKYTIVRSPKSYNSQVGVPLSVWQINPSHQLGIFEAGISEPGEMEKLEHIIRPETGILTNIGEAHSEGFTSLQQKIEEKLKLFLNAGMVIYCSDYADVNLCLQHMKEKGFTGRLFSWSKKQHATLAISGIEKRGDSTLITAAYQGQTISIQIPFTDDASIENAITCWCLLLLQEVPMHDIASGMSRLAPVAMRLELKRGINNCSIINDSYSADISSLKIALDFLDRMQHHSRKTIILSDLLETGKDQEELYAQISGFLSNRNISRLIGIGKTISAHQHVFKRNDGLQTLFFENVDAFRASFYELNFRDETILLKGARIFAFEQISRLLEQQQHQTVLEINQHALLYNLRQYHALLKPTTRIMAMVKAFSYGSGSFEIASVLEFHKVDYLAVAYADEGVELRKAGIRLPIMVMNSEPVSFELIRNFSLQPVVYSFDMLKRFDQFLKKSGDSAYPVHIEIETGMNRLGFLPADATLLVTEINQSNMKVQSVYSHLVASEDPASDDFTNQQFTVFMETCKQLEAGIGYTFLKHIDNSAGISRHPQFQLDMVRLGIGLYGIDTASNAVLDLKEVTTLKTTVAQVKHVRSGETVSYGRRWIAQRDSVIATVRIGYADGYPRRLSNGRGKMLIRSQLAPVVGSICMDMTMVDVTEIPAVREGDEVIVFGNDLPVLQVAEWAETIPYEIMTGISQRVRRVYFEES
jgi:alanine racemase